MNTDQQSSGKLRKCSVCKKEFLLQHTIVRSTKEQGERIYCYPDYEALFGPIQED